MKDFLKDMIKNSFGGFNDLLNDIVKQLSMSPDAYNSTVWSIITTIRDILLPVGYSLLALFFLLEFLNKTITIEHMRWEDVAKILLKMVLAKMVMENSMMFLTAIFNMSSSWIESVHQSTSGMEYNLDVVNQINSHIDGMGILKSIGFLASILPFYVVMWAVKIAVSLIVYGRMIEIYIYTAVSPLPLATIANESLQGTAKKFFQSYIGVCLQGLILLIACKIYGGLISNAIATGSVWDTMKNMVTAGLVLLLVMVKSGNWAKQITGAM